MNFLKESNPIFFLGGGGGGGGSGVGGGGGARVSEFFLQRILIKKFWGEGWGGRGMIE